MLETIKELTLVDWANIATVITLGIIAYQLRLRRKQSQKERAFHFVEKHYDRDHIEHVISAMDFFREKFISQETKWQLANNEPNIKKNVRIYMNYFEELGLSYNKGIIDKSLIELMIGEASLSNYDELRWFVKRFQDEDIQDEPDIPEELLTYIQWTNMNKQILKGKNRKKMLNAIRKKIIDVYKGDW